MFLMRQICYTANILRVTLVYWMDNLVVIDGIIHNLYDVCLKFNQNFYNETDILIPKSLKRLKIDDALKNTVFMNRLIPKYLNYLSSGIGLDKDFLFNLGFDYDFRYRVKSIDTLNKKLYHNCGKDMYMAKILNDCFGGRIILPNVQVQEADVMIKLKQLKDDGLISRFYKRDDGCYHAVHCYFQKQNSWFPWELQIWDQACKKDNYLEHKRHEIERNS